MLSSIPLTVRLIRLAEADLARQSATKQGEFEPQIEQQND
jgi:hypothetical protein